MLCVSYMLAALSVNHLGIIPYDSVFDTQAQARRRGYWIPGVPVNAKIVSVERNTDRRIHLINALL